MVYRVRLTVRQVRRGFTFGIVFRVKHLTTHEDVAAELVGRAKKYRPRSKNTAKQLFLSPTHYKLFAQGLEAATVVSVVGRFYNTNNIPIFRKRDDLLRI